MEYELVLATLKTTCFKFRETSEESQSHFILILLFAICLGIFFVFYKLISKGPGNHNVHKNKS
jgi:hypothetical protein